MMATELVSIILPVHNEAGVLKRTIDCLGDSLGQKFEIIISEDGSTDDTVRIAKSLENKRVRLLHNGKRMGKGAAIKHAASYAQGSILLFMDADLASNPSQIKELVRLLEGGADIVIGSRYLKGSRAKRVFMRDVASRSFNFLVRAMLGSRIMDHQCGFKAFRKDTVLPVINEVENQKWFWDTELLVRAQRKGLKIAEIPIEWNEMPGSKFRLLEDTIHMAWGLIKFKIKEG